MGFNREKALKDGTPPPIGHNGGPGLLDGKKVVLSSVFLAVGTGVMTGATFVNREALREYLDSVGMTIEEFFQALQELI